MLKKEKILKRLQEHLDYAIECGYNKDRILGIFLYGSQNYNLDSENSDIDSKIIILPSFEDFCLQKTWLSKEIILENGEHIDIKDIRMYRDSLIKQNINYVETLFTEYKILNPKYEFAFNTYFIENKELFAHLDEKRTIFSMSEMAKCALRQFKTKTDYKKIYNGARLLIFLNKYISHYDYLDCCRPSSEHDLLISLKNGKHPIFEKSLDEIFIDVQTLIDQINLKISSIEMKPLDENIQSILDESTVAIIRQSFVLKQEKKEISQRDFFKKLTHAEERAYNSIIKNVGVEGNFSISKLISENEISRPVYTNLLNKMKDDKIADIINMGVKGTYINIINSEFRVKILRDVN